MSLRILLADESSTIKKAFELGLNSFGAEVKNVQHGIDVLEVAEHFNPDIIFADVLISKMNGYEVCSQIKNHHSLSSIPVVLMWSGFMDIDEDKYFTCQADGKIEKPFSADQLMTIIKTLVQKPIGERLDIKSQNRPEPTPLNPSDFPPQLKPATLSTSNEQPPKLGGNLKINPTEDLLFKEDLPPLKNPNFDDFETSEDLSEDDFELDGFQALDLHDDSKEANSGVFNFDFKGSSNYEDDFKETTIIPTPEEEAQLLAKVNEDTNIRHGYGFLNSELQDELSNPSINLNQLKKDFANSSGIDFSTGPDLNEDIFGEELNNDSEFYEEILTSDQGINKNTSNTIHRDVEDLHNSDMGMLSSADDLLEAYNKVDVKTEFRNSAKSPVNTIEVPKTGLQLLTKEEIRTIVQDQAKELIQSIVWELIPELSKQMIEKEIKRLLAANDSPPSLK